MKLIALAGQMRNGKDQIADFLIEQFDKVYSEKWAKSGWAEGLKSVVCDSFGLTRDDLEKFKLIPTPPRGFLKTIRQALQLVGDDFRQIKEDVWISWTMSRAKPCTVLVDTRYPNELQKIRESNGVNVLVIRSGFANEIQHASESHLKKIIDFFNGIYGHTFEGEVHDFDQVKRDNPDIVPPPGAEFVDFVVRNDSTILNLQRRTAEEVLPFVCKKLGYESKVDHSDSCISAIDGSMPHLQPIWGRMGEWVLYKQYDAPLNDAMKKVGQYEILTEVLGLNSREAEIMLSHLRTVRMLDDLGVQGETSVGADKPISCKPDNIKDTTILDVIGQGIPQSLKGCQILSDYDILVDWLGYSPKEAKIRISRLRLQKIRDLKQQTVLQNPCPLAASDVKVPKNKKRGQDERRK